MFCTLHCDFDVTVQLNPTAFVWIKWQENVSKLMSDQFKKFVMKFSFPTKEIGKNVEGCKISLLATNRPKGAGRATSTYMITPRKL